MGEGFSKKSMSMYTGVLLGILWHRVRKGEGESAVKRHCQAKTIHAEKASRNDPGLGGGEGLSPIII